MKSIKRRFHEVDYAVDLHGHLRVQGFRIKTTIGYCLAEESGDTRQPIR
jgi:hypothetical protein